MEKGMDELTKLIPFEVEVREPEENYFGELGSVLLGKTWTVVGCLSRQYRWGSEYLLTRKGEMPQWVCGSCLVASS